MIERQPPAPRAKLHQLDEEELLPILVFAAVALVVVVLLVRAHPVRAGLVGCLVAVIALALVAARARWADRVAAKDDPPAPGVVIGHVTGSWRLASRRPFRLPWPSFRQHVCIVGPTGRGKTFTFVEPLLRAHVSRPGTGVLYLDGKGDPIHEQVPFDGVFCPERPEESACWNPLAGGDPVQAANLLAAGLFPEAAVVDAPGAFYAARAVYAITRVAPAMAYTGYGTPNEPEILERTDSDSVFAELIERGVEQDTAAGLVRDHGKDRVARQLAWLEHRTADRQSPDKLVQAIRRSWQPPPIAPVTYQVNLSQLSRVLFSPDRLKGLAAATDSARTVFAGTERGSTLEQLHHDLEGLLGLHERERAAVFQSLQNRLGYFLEPPFRELCSRSDITIGDIALGARLAFLLPTGRFPNTARPLGRVALSQFKNAVLASEPMREKVAVLDEFHNFVSSDFAAFLNQARSRGGAAIMALQSLGDLPREECDAMIANISTFIVTPGCRPRDAEYFAEAFGKTPQERHSVTYEAPTQLDLGHRPMVRTQVMEDFRFTPTEISELDPREALIQVTSGRRSWPATRVAVERQHG